MVAPTGADGTVRRLRQYGSRPAFKAPRHTVNADVKATPGAITRLAVVRIAGRPARLAAAGLPPLACALGRSGVAAGKREGDGATPRGVHRLLAGFYRPDRVKVRPRSPLPLAPLRRDLGWCDDPRHPAYNRPVRLPFRASHEAMWRDDGLYDLVLVVDWNLSPRARGRGSAIFVHVARPGLAPTEGCVALAPADLGRLLPRLAKRTCLVV